MLELSKSDFPRSSHGCIDFLHVSPDLVHRLGNLREPFEAPPRARMRFSIQLQSRP